MAFEGIDREPAHGPPVPFWLADRRRRERFESGMADHPIFIHPDTFQQWLAAGIIDASGRVRRAWLEAQR